MSQSIPRVHTCPPSPAIGSPALADGGHCVPHLYRQFTPASPHLQVAARRWLRNGDDMVSVEVGRGEGAWGGEVSDLRLEAGLRGEERFEVRSTGLGWGWGDKRSALRDCTSPPP